MSATLVLSQTKVQRQERQSGRENLIYIVQVHIGIDSANGKNYGKNYG